MQPQGAWADRIGRITVSSTMKVAAEADRLRREGADIVDLSAGEPDFPTPENVKRAAVKAIEENFTKYTAAAGTPELREAVCRRHAEDFGTCYSPSECIITVGGKHAIFNFTQVLIQKGDEVIIPVPYWVTFKDVVSYAGGHCVFVRTDEAHGYALTAEMIERHITDRTKMVIINSPSNPSGAVLDGEEFARILHLTSKRGIWLLTDESYCQFLYDSTPFSIASLPEAKETVLVVGSVSKTYSMTGWRIGFGLGPSAVIAAAAKLQSHSTSNPTSVAQKAAIEALTGSQDAVKAMLEEYRRRRDFVMERLRGITGVTCAEPRGAFYVYPNVSAVFGSREIHTPLDFATRLLEQARVAVVPGEAFGTHKHVRISYAASMEELAKGLDRLQRFVEGLCA